MGGCLAREGAVQKHSDLQREVSSLLERESMWTDTCVFTVHGVCAWAKTVVQTEDRE